MELEDLRADTFLDGCWEVWREDENRVIGWVTDKGVVYHASDKRQPIYWLAPGDLDVLGTGLLVLFERENSFDH